jgi:ubiquinone/menaquinone biosynthesis C-methylase UbiE
MLREARKKAPEKADLILADIEALPIIDGCFDMVYSISVIQLINNPKGGIEEIMRVLKEGGMAAISILRKSQKIREVAEAYGEELQFIDSDSMKDAFIVGMKPVRRDGED